MNGLIIQLKSERKPIKIICWDFLLFIMLVSLYSCEKQEETFQQAEPGLLPFDEHADAAADIQRAIEKAKLTDKKILLVFGANRSKALHKFIHTDVEIQNALSRTFVVVWINVGSRDKNMDIDARYGSPVAKGRIPVFVILNSNGDYLATQETDVFEKPEVQNQTVVYDRSKILEFIYGWSSSNKA